MADLDVEIDVPDDDGLDPPIRVVNGGLVPPWIKAVLVAVAGTALAVVVAAYLFGRSRSVEELPATLSAPSATSPTTAPASAPTESGIERSLEAVTAWQQFSNGGDLEALNEYFHPDGPQYALFAAQAGQAAGSQEGQPDLTDPVDPADPADGDGPAGDLVFTPRNLSETVADGVSTVSLDLAVSSPDGEMVYPYQLVYLASDSRVWTVVDRRSPGSVAVPPPAATVELAEENWALFTTAVTGGDGAGALAVVSETTRQLAAEVAGAVQAGTTTPQQGTELPTDPELFAVLVERARAADATTAEQAVLALLDPEQQAAITDGGLGLWTQVDPERIIASLQVDGQAVATVPFVASTGGWVFDLAGALGTSQGGSQ